MIDVLLQYVLWFFVYSFLGWVHEVIYFAVTERRFSNGGIVVAPLLPIYGLGAVAIIACTEPFTLNPFIVFVLSAVLASTVEYVGHWLLDVLFHVKLWDYSNRRLNLQGRICFENSLGFGVLALFLIYVVHPFIEQATSLLPSSVLYTTAIGLLCLFGLDLANTVRSLMAIRQAAPAIESLSLLQQRFDTYLLHLREARATWRKQYKRLSTRLHRDNIRRLKKAFPNIQFTTRRRKNNE